MNTNTTANPWAPSSFGGDFDLLPLRAQVLFGEIPLYPTSEDFQNAGCLPLGTEVAARWRMEAIRWRRGEGYGRPLNEGLKAIAVACAERFYAAAQAER